MPPLLIALGIVGLYFLVPKSQRTGSVNFAVTPNNTPVGINAFPAPLPVNQAPAPVNQGQTNKPNTSQSGLPTTSPQAQKTAPPLQSNDDLYFSYPHVLQPTYVPTAVPPSPAKSGCSGCSGGCSGGGCGSAGAGISDCSTSQGRAQNAGCLAPTTRSLITPASVPVLNKWLANLASYPGANAFSTYQDLQYAMQSNNPVSENDTAPPIGYVEPSIGLSYRKPRRGLTT